MNEAMSVLISKVLKVGFTDFLKKGEISSEEIKTLDTFIRERQGMVGVLSGGGFAQASIINGLSLVANRQTRGMFPLFPCHNIQIESDGSCQVCRLLDMPCSCLLADFSAMSCFWKIQDTKVRQAVNPRYIRHPNGIIEVIISI